MDKIQVICGKCNGKGILTEYKHISGGTCFACHGIGYFEYNPKQLELKNKRKLEKVENRLKTREQARRKHAEELYKFVETVKDNQVFLKLMGLCSSELYYEQHLMNAMKYMVSKGLYIIA